MPAALLVAFYLALTLAPIALAWAAGLPPRPFRDDLSSGLAMAAFAAMLIEFVLSGRFRTVSGRVGMDVTMRMHQLLARSLLGFVLLHPFLYSLPILENPPPWDVTAATHLKLEGASIVTGLLAWIGLGVLVITGIARDQTPVRYEGWRLGHGLGAALVAWLTLEHARGAGRYAALPQVEAFWLAMTGLAGATLVWVYAVSPALQLLRSFKVVSSRRIAERTWELIVAPKRGRGLRFHAGQFVWLRIARTPFGVGENPFSIASAPSAGPNLEFVIREAGDFTSGLGALRPGDPVWIDGPYGALRAPPKAQRVGLIGGGVGVAPLLSILREMRASGDPRPVRLLHGERDAGRLVYADELARVDACGGVGARMILSDPPPGWTGMTGLIDEAAIRETFGDPRDWSFVICGPPPMMNAVERILRAHGVRAGDISLERFVYD